VRAKTRSTPAVQWNQSQLVGWTTKDPALCCPPKGQPYVKLVIGAGVRVTKTWTFTDFHHVAAYHPPLIDFVCKYVRKGDYVFIVGCLRQRPRLVGKSKWVTSSRIEIYKNMGRLILLGFPKIFQKELREMRIREEEGSLDPKEKVELASAMSAHLQEFSELNSPCEDESPFEGE